MSTDRRRIAKAHLATLAEFYRNLAVGLFLAFILGTFAQGLVEVFRHAADLWVFGSLGLVFLLYSQYVTERYHD